MALTTHYDRDQTLRVILWHWQYTFPRRPPPRMQLRRGNTMPARNIRDRDTVPVTLQHDLGLHMLGPTPPTTRTRHKLDTPGISSIVTVRSYAIL
jgi:hypothetical protein